MPKPSLGTSGKEAKAEIQEDHARIQRKEIAKLIHLQVKAEQKEGKPTVATILKAKNIDLQFNELAKERCCSAYGFVCNPSLPFL